VNKQTAWLGTSAVLVQYTVMQDEMSAAGSSSPLRPYRISNLWGKGEGLVATQDLFPGHLILDESPLLLLDPPCKRNDLLMLLGCRLFSTIDMRTTPDKIRLIHELISLKLTYLKSGIWLFGYYIFFELSVKCTLVRHKRLVLFLKL
jgi:hypothetical protein